MIAVAVVETLLTRRLTLLDSSSGDVACAIAYVGAFVGLPTTGVVSFKRTKEKRTVFEPFGASVVVGRNSNAKNVEALMPARDSALQ
jgi:cysteine synthase